MIPEDVKQEMEILTMLNEHGVSDNFVGSKEIKENKVRCLCLLPLFNFSLRKVARHMGLSESYFLVQNYRDEFFKESVQLITQFQQSSIVDKFYDLIDDTNSDMVKADLLKFYLERQAGWSKTTRTDITTNGQSLSDIQIIEIQTPKII